MDPHFVGTHFNIHIARIIPVIMMRVMMMMVLFSRAHDEEGGPNIGWMGRAHTEGKKTITLAQRQNSGLIWCFRFPLHITHIAHLVV